MQNQPLERFLKHRSNLSRHATLGRVFNVTRESWPIGDDPQLTHPKRLLLLTGHTASEAADLARERAEAFPRHGFDKLSGSWWGADAEQFHRFIVHTSRPRGQTAAAIAGTGVAGLILFALFRRHRGSRTRS